MPESFLSKRQPLHTMHKASVASLDDLANNYAVRWSAQRPAPDAEQPDRRAELRPAREANEVFLCLTEFLPNYSRCGINE